jgi:hypothetical protein
MVKTRDAKSTDVNIRSISITPTGQKNSIKVTVTSGALQGRSAQVITVPPSGAYFNDVAPPSAGKAKKRA